MRLIFPDFETIINLLETEHASTKDSEYFKEKKVLEAAAKAFGNREMEIEGVKHKLGLILNDTGCLMPWATSVSTIDNLTKVLKDCAARRANS